MEKQTCQFCNGPLKVKGCTRCGAAMAYCPKCCSGYTVELCEGCILHGGGWYRTRDAAQYLHMLGKTDQVVNVQTIRRWHHKGHLEGERFGGGKKGRLNFTRDVLDAFEPQTPGARTGQPPKSTSE